jgi:hypothetical protein
VTTEAREARRQARRLLSSVQVWRSELAEVLDPASGAPAQRLLAVLDGAATTLDARRTPAAAKTAVQEAFFLTDRSSDVVQALGPTLARHLAARMALAFTSDTDEPVRLWTPELLASTTLRVKELVEFALRAVELAPHLTPEERQTYTAAVAAVGRSLDTGAASSILTADGRLASVVGRFHGEVVARQTAIASTLEPKAQDAQTRWRSVEDEAWRYGESTLYGGRGCGTVALVVMGTTLLALILHGLAIRLILAAVAGVGGIVWVYVNFVWGPNVAERYGRVTDEAKGLVQAADLFRRDFLVYNAKVSDLKGRIREGPVGPR